METWKKIDDYENYSVSTMGRVRNNERGGRIMKGSKDAHGYLNVSLYKNNVKKTYLIHRLVAIAFISNLENKPCIDHCNNDKTDNRAESLRWCTYTENQMNRQITSRNTSGCKGVTFYKPTQKWKASITIDRIEINLGYFDKKEDARDARKTRANEAFGVFVNSCERVDGKE